MENKTTITNWFSGLMLNYDADKQSALMAEAKEEFSKFFIDKMEVSKEDADDSAKTHCVDFDRDELILGLSNLMNPLLNFETLSKTMSESAKQIPNKIRIILLNI